MKNFGSKLLVVVVVLPIAAFVAWLAYNITHVNQIRERGEHFATDIHGIATEFRQHFHNRADYPTYTLEQLVEAHILSDDALAKIKMYHGRYQPFSPQTSDSEAVLSLKESTFSSWFLTKSDLLLDPTTPILIPKKDQKPSGSPSPR